MWPLVDGRVGRGVGLSHTRQQRLRCGLEISPRIFGCTIMSERGLSLLCMVWEGAALTGGRYHYPSFLTPHLRGGGARLRGPAFLIAAPPPPGVGEGKTQHNRSEFAV